MSNVMIQITDLCKTYQMGENVVRALDHVNLQIKEHEFVSIIGPSGSGKSTLMNMLGCLDVPSSGEYFLDGAQIKKMSDNELAKIRNEKIGFVFQGFNLLPKLSAIENVELPLIYQGKSVKERREKAKKALESVGLLERMHHKPSELSRRTTTKGGYCKSISDKSTYYFGRRTYRKFRFKIRKRSNANISKTIPRRSYHYFNYA